MIARNVTVVITAMALTACGLAMNEAERIARAESYIAENDYRAANIELRNVLIGNPDNLEARLLLANVSLALNDPDSARKELARAAGLGANIAVIQELNVRILALDGQNLEVLAALAQDDLELPEFTILRYRGEALIGLQNAEAALQNYGRWLELEPDSPDAAVGYVKATAIAGRQADAMARLEAILDVHVDHAEAWQTMGMLQYGLGDYTASRDAYRRSLELEDRSNQIRRYLTTLLGLADAELMLRDTVAARRVVNQLAAISPSSPQVLLQKARVAQLEQDYYAAADALYELLSITPNDPRVLMFLANVQSRLGSTEQAIVLYRRVVTLAPDNIQARKQLADLQLQRSDSRAAIEILAPLIGSADEDADVNRLLAIASLQQGNAIDALERLEAALASEPANVDRKIALAEAYLSSGQPDRVGDLLTDAELATVAGSRVMIAALVQQGNDSAAAEIAQSLLADHPDNSEAYEVASDYYRSVGNFDRAEDLLRQSLELDDSNARARVKLAVIASQSGRMDEALALYREVLQIDPTNLPALIALGQDAARDADNATAIDYFERARNAHKDSLAPRLLLASIHYNAQEFDRAEELAREMAAIGTNEAPINAVIGSILIETGALEEAVAVYQAAATQAPDSLTVLLGLARSQMALDRTDAARETLRHALDVDPENIIAVPALALVEFRLGDLDTALERLAAHTARHPNDVNGRLVSGDVFSAQGDYDNAIAAYRAAIEGGAGPTAVIREYEARVQADLDPVSALDTWLEAHPDDSAIRAKRAEHFMQTGDREAAVSEYEALLGADQSNPVYLNNLAWEYQQAGNLDKALELAEKARELEPDSGSIADTLGWIYFERGDVERSESLLREAVRQSPGNKEIAYHLATVLAQTGRQAEAASLLRTILESGEPFASVEAARNLLRTL